MALNSHVAIHGTPPRLAGDPTQVKPGLQPDRSRPAAEAQLYYLAVAATMLAARSAMTRVGASVLPVVMVGITEASAIRKFDVP
jgi:hypothetical protein